MTIERLRKMFTEMVEAKDVAAIERFYDPELRLWTNGEVQDYAAFADGHRRVYPTAITYHVEYDEDAWVQDDVRDRVAGRVWITTARPGEEPTRLELVLIVEYAGDRIIRVWETTYPSWQQLPAFDEY